MDDNHKKETPAVAQSIPNVYSSMLNTRYHVITINYYKKNKENYSVKQLD